MKARQKRQAIAWPFPHVVYDYAAAGVGSERVVKPMEVDKAEVARIHKFFQEGR